MTESVCVPCGYSGKFFVDQNLLSFRLYRSPLYTMKEDGQGKPPAPYTEQLQHTSSGKKWLVTNVLLGTFFFVLRTLCPLRTSRLVSLLLWPRPLGCAMLISPLLSTFFATVDKQDLASFSSLPPSVPCRTSQSKQDACLRDKYCCETSMGGTRDL